MVQLLYSPWLAHMILGSFAVSIVASLKISVAFLSHSVWAVPIYVSGDGVKVGPRAEISLSAHSSAAAWLARQRHRQHRGEAQRRAKDRGDLRHRVHSPVKRGLDT